MLSLLYERSPLLSSSAKPLIKGTFCAASLCYSIYNASVSGDQIPLGATPCLSFAEPEPLRLPPASCTPASSAISPKACTPSDGPRFSCFVPSLDPAFSSMEPSGAEPELLCEFAEFDDPPPCDLAICLAWCSSAYFRS